jgi:hypothetical protein
LVQSQSRLQEKRGKLTDGGASRHSSLHRSIAPSLHRSIAPSLHRSIAPARIFDLRSGHLIRSSASARITRPDFRRGGRPDQRSVPFAPNQSGTRFAERICNVALRCNRVCGKDDSGGAHALHRCVPLASCLGFSVLLGFLASCWRVGRVVFASWSHFHTSRSRAARVSHASCWMS